MYTWTFIDIWNVYRDSCLQESDYKEVFTRMLWRLRILECMKWVWCFQMLREVCGIQVCSVWEERLPYIQNLILQRQNNISSIYNFLNSDSTLFLKTVSTVSESWLSCLCLNVMWIYVVLVAAVFATFSFACESILSWLLQCLPHILFHANTFWKCQSPFSSFGCIHLNFAENWPNLVHMCEG